MLTTAYRPPLPLQASRKLSITSVTSSFGCQALPPSLHRIRRRNRRKFDDNGRWETTSNNFDYYLNEFARLINCKLLRVLLFRSGVLRVLLLVFLRSDNKRVKITISLDRIWRDESNRWRLCVDQFGFQLDQFFELWSSSNLFFFVCYMIGSRVEIVVFSRELDVRRREIYFHFYYSKRSSKFYDRWSWRILIFPALQICQ